MTQDCDVMELKMTRLRRKEGDSLGRQRLSASIPVALQGVTQGVHLTTLIEKEQLCLHLNVLMSTRF